MNASMFLIKGARRDTRRYITPTAIEIAIAFNDLIVEPPFDRDVRVYSKGYHYNNSHHSLLSSRLDPMTYTLFLPHGEGDCQPNLSMNSCTNILQKTSLLHYIITQLTNRENKF